MEQLSKLSATDSAGNDASAAAAVPRLDTRVALATQLEAWLYIASAWLWLLGSAPLVLAAYPESLLELVTTAAADAANPSRLRALSTLERYVTASGVLAGGWLFATGSLLFTIGAVAGVVARPTDVVACVCAAGRGLEPRPRAAHPNPKLSARPNPKRCYGRVRRAGTCLHAPFCYPPRFSCGSAPRPTRWRPTTARARTTSFALLAAPLLRVVAPSTGAKTFGAAACAVGAWTLISTWATTSWLARGGWPPSSALVCSDGRHPPTPPDPKRPLPRCHCIALRISLRIPTDLLHSSASHSARLRTRRHAV